ncbi:MAG TPA: tetratricopeptide repeat protein [bacterium]|nr:tetratricopeptide repeat protein [bacterium]
MIVCPACHAENPDGTKICVKCATELPKAVPAGKAKAVAVAEAPKGKGLKDISRDMVDLLWLAVIIVIIFMAFWYEATNGTWHLAVTEEAKIAQAPVFAEKPVRHKAREAFSHKGKVVEPPVPGASAVEEPVIPPAPGETVASSVPPVLAPPQNEAEANNIERPMAPKGSAETFFQKGKTQYDSKHYQTSFNFLKQALEIDPTFAKAYFGLGYLYSRFDMNDAAVRMYEMALRFDPAHVDSINNLAMMYYHAGNTDDALDLLQKASGMESQNADVQYNLGSIYLEKNQNDEALQAFQKASAVRPKDAAIYNNMALTYEKLGKKQEAQDSWRKVLEYSNSSVLLRQAKDHLDFLQAQS